MKKQKFLRVQVNQYSKLGLRRKKKLRYRKGKGLDNKIRLKMKGHLRNVEVGFRTEKKTRDLVKGKKVVMISNLSDLNKIEKGTIGVLEKIGNKKKMKIAEKAMKDNIKFINFNPEKFLSNLKKNVEERQKESEEKKAEKIKRDKKAEKKAAEDKKKEEKDKKADKVEEKSEVNKVENKKDVGEIKKNEEKKAESKVDKTKKEAKKEKKAESKDMKEPKE